MYILYYTSWLIFERNLMMKISCYNIQLTDNEGCSEVILDILAQIPCSPHYIYLPPPCGGIIENPIPIDPPLFQLSKLKSAIKLSFNYYHNECHRVVIFTFSLSSSFSRSMAIFTNASNPVHFYLYCHSSYRRV